MLAILRPYIHYEILFLKPLDFRLCLFSCLIFQHDHYSSSCCFFAKWFDEPNCFYSIPTYRMCLWMSSQGRTIQPTLTARPFVSRSFYGHRKKKEYALAIKRRRDSQIRGLWRVLSAVRPWIDDENAAAASRFRFAVLFLEPQTPC